MRKVILSTLMAAFALAAAADNITQSEAQEIANQFFASKGISVASGAKRTFQSPHDTELNDLYLFNAAGAKGFVIISGVDNTPAILGYSLTGSISSENMPPQVKWWLQEYAKQIKSVAQSSTLAKRSAVSAQPKGTQRNIMNGIATLHQPIKPLVSANWGQERPYNNLTPVIEGSETPTGCVATALAQVMHYYKYPAQALDSTTRYGYTYNRKSVFHDSLNPATFDWDKMRDVYTPTDSDASAQEVAKLMSFVGRAMKMQYTPTALRRFTTSNV